MAPTGAVFARLWYMSQKWELPSGGSYTSPLLVQAAPVSRRLTATCPSHRARRLEELVVITNKLSSIYLIVFVGKQLTFFLNQLVECFSC